MPTHIALVHTASRPSVAARLTSGDLRVSVRLRESAADMALYAVIACAAALAFTAVLRAPDIAATLDVMTTVAGL